MTTSPSDPKTVERQPRGSVSAIPLSDVASSLSVDLLLARSREEYFLVADRLRLLSDDVIRFVKRLP